MARRWRPFRNSRLPPVVSTSTIVLCQAGPARLRQANIVMARKNVVLSISFGPLDRCNNPVYLTSNAAASAAVPSIVMSTR